MPDLAHSLQRHDLGHLRMIAERWGVELAAPDADSAILEICQQIKNPELAAEVIHALPDEARAALQQIIAAGGRLPWVQFTRLCGKVREMGSGRRDRLRPDQNSISAAEMLWYRALVARAFFETPRGNEEFAYIPDDLLPLIPAAPPNTNPTPGRAATPSERANPISISDQLLEQACTLLAAQRLGRENIGLPAEIETFLKSLLTSAKILTPDSQPDLERARAHLEASRSAALSQLAQDWLFSATHNDLRLIPHLQAEGNWQNDPLAARQFIMRQLQKLPPQIWWSLSAFIADIKQQNPDFQRPAGDYDSWYLRDVNSSEFLRGFEHWDDVDGALIRYMICGPLHWLGFVDIATPEADAPTLSGSAFRLSSWWPALLAGTPPKGLPPEIETIHLRSDGRVGVPLASPRAIRYQIARFCRWEESTAHEFRYQLTTDSLTLAHSQGLQIGHLLAILQKNAQPVPPNIIRALKRWEAHGSEIRTSEAVILRVRDPEILDKLRQSRAARYLGDPLGPTAIIIKTGAAEKVLGALLEMGYFGEIFSHI